MTLGAANLSHARPGSPSWLQNASKKIDVAWQFPAAVIEYIGVGVKKTRLKRSFPESTDHNSVRLTRPVARNLCGGAGASRKRSSRGSYPVGRAAFILDQKGDTLYEENPTMDFGSLRCPVVGLNALLEFLDAGGFSPRPGEKGPGRSQQSRE
jgi:hypothetical protein